MFSIEFVSYLTLDLH